ncbi:hypothetical protein HRbin29_01307 [bacterium HR29]|jgi:hypothetical protein|nr:hypothetical protein HRbin29_01307 [bacterium HR29]
MAANRRWRLPLGSLVGSLALVVLAACGGGTTPTSKIFRAPPWNGPETYRYQLVQREHLYGYCELKTLPDAEPGKTKLERRCYDEEGFRDDGSALVDSATLQPFASTRVNFDPRRNRTATRTAVYGPEEVTLTLDLDGELRTATRKLPKPDEASPDPGWYDDESMLWLVRGIPLEEGWKGAYHNVSVGTAQVAVAEVTVLRKTRVTVPAGAFDAWEVLVRSSITNRIWVNASAPHQIVKAQIEQITYELLPD